MYLYISNMHCDFRSGEGMRSPGVDIIGCEYPMWVLGTEFGCSGGVASGLYCSGMSSALFLFPLWFQNFDEEPSAWILFWAVSITLLPSSFCESSSSAQQSLCPPMSLSTHSMHTYSEKFLVWARCGGICLQSQHLEIWGRRTATRPIWDIQWDSVSHKITISPCRNSNMFIGSPSSDDLSPWGLAVQWSRMWGRGQWNRSIYSPTGRSISGELLPLVVVPLSLHSFSCTTNWLSLVVHIES